MGRNIWMGNAPNTATQVAELQTSFFNLGRKKDPSYYYDTALRIEKLQEDVVEAEKNFYAKLGITGIEELQERLDSLNKDKGFRSMLNLDNSSFDEIVEAAFNKIDPTEPLEFIIEDEELLQNLKEIGEEISIQQFVATLNRTKGIETKKLTKIRNYKNGSKIGLGSFLSKVTLIEDSLPMKVKVETKKEGELFRTLPRHWQNRLENDYNLRLANYDIFEIIEKKVLGLISDMELKSYVEYQFKENRDKYDLNDSKASIKGFLGEVHTAATLDYIFGKKGIAIPSGKIKSYLGREIPIDIVLEEYGFQVKNYRVLDGVFRTIPRREQAMGAANFVEERLRPSASIADIMIDFFGSYQFNQPIEDATDRYHQIYNRFSQNEEIARVFCGYLDNILKISDSFGTEDLEFLKQPKLYFNTFFIIGEKIVPSSKILQAIKETLKEYNNENSVSAQYWITTPSGGITWKKNQIFTGTPIKELANQVKIDWKIELRIDDILDKAIRKLI